MRFNVLLKSIVIAVFSALLLMTSMKIAQSNIPESIATNPQSELLTQRPTMPRTQSETLSESSFMRADHVAIRVSKFEETVQWYKDKLGFKEQVEWTVKALPGMQLAYLELNGFRLEIIGGNFKTTRKPPANFQEALNVEGYGHICFEVGNVDAVLAELKRRGVPTFAPAATYPLGSTWRRVGFVLDNNGNVIELGEPLTITKPQRT